MKKTNLFFACTIVLGSLAACNSGTDTTSSTTTTNTTDSMNAATNNSNTTPATDSPATTTPATTASATPLKGADSVFAMKAAIGGMMEVEAGNAAQQNAASDRVKAFGAMMVTDHSKANSELMALASSKGMTLPAAMPADKKKHVDEMAKMKGKSFDSHYMGMMLTDHKKDVADFEKEATSGTDPDLKAWAAKTLPTLKAHLDSAQAINKGKM